MKQNYLHLAIALSGVSLLSACAVSEAPSHATVLKSERIQQVVTPSGPKFVNCAVAHCPPRSAKSIGVDAPAIRIDVPTDAPKPIQTVVKKPQELVLVSEQLLRSVTVRFRWNSAQLDPKEKARLNELASILKDAKRVRVLGRTDGTGTGDANDRLANKRAMSVMLHLRDVVNGTSEDKVQLSSKGLCCYVADNQTKAGRSNNRRAEVEIYGDVEAPGHPNN